MWYTCKQRTVLTQSKTKWQVSGKVNKADLEIQPKITRLAFYEHWLTAGAMYRNYVGVDRAFEKTALGAVRRPFLRWIGFPLYFGFANHGYALRIDDKVAGVIYLQYRKMVAHINDIEVNRAYQGRGLSHYLLDFAQTQAYHHQKRFLTLVVTLTNHRALNLYRKSGFLEQHYRYFYLSRSSFQAAESSPHPTYENRLTLRPLQGRAAAQNLRHFFQDEIRQAEPITCEVWEALYPPRLPVRGRGSSFALFWNNAVQPAGHADFFDWGSHGRWRIYLAGQYWGTSDEQALFELLIGYNQAHGLNRLSIMLGSESHHSQARTLARHLGFVERDSERMLMIKII